MKKQETVNTVKNNDDFSSSLMESYGKWMGGDCFQNTNLPDIHEAPFDGMDPQSNGAEIEQTTKRKKGPTQKGAYVGQESKPQETSEEYEVLEREEVEIDGELYVIEKRRYATEGMAQARDNVGASTCWKGYKAKGTKKKGGKEVPNCVKEHHKTDENGNTIPHEDGDKIEEAKRGLYANIHAKRKRGEAPAKPGDEDYPAKDAFKKAAKTAKKEEVEVADESLKQARKNVGASTCWDGYKAKGTKMKNGRKVPNCVKEFSEWRKIAEKK